MDLVADEPFSPRNVATVPGVLAPTRDRREQTGWRAEPGPGTGRNQSLTLVVVATSVIMWRQLHRADDALRGEP